MTSNNMTPQQKKQKRLRYKQNLKIRREIKKNDDINDIEMDLESLTGDDELNKTISYGDFMNGKMINPFQFDELFKSNNNMSFETPDEYLYTVDEINEFHSYKQTIIIDITHLLNVFKMNNDKTKHIFNDTYPFYQNFFNKTFVEPLNTLKMTALNTSSYKTLDNVKEKLNTLRNNLDKITKKEMTIDDLIFNDGFFN